MCGHDWCSVRISKEIQDFASGKDAESQPEKRAQQSTGVTTEGLEVLEKRGNLTPDQIHALAHKGQKSACHSDVVEDPQQAKVVQVNTLKAHGVAVNESGL
jgi:phosphomethylpyrimidine synthase